MANDRNVTSAKPAVAGAISTAPIGTEVPSDAKMSLDPSFVSLGYISEDGLTNSNSPESDPIKAWGGDTVSVTQTSKEDTFSYTLIEVLNINVLKQVYGEGNVTGSLDTGITIKANAKPLESHVIAIDLILREGILKRIVIPNARVIEIGEIVYADSDVVGYETTVQAIPDEQGNTHYEYIEKP